MADRMRRINKLFQYTTNTIYAIVSLALLVISLVMIGYAVSEVWYALYEGDEIVTTLLDAIGLIVISIAVFDVTKYLMEEEVLHDRELRSTREARRTLTKFLVIICIAVTLEALVFIFGAGTTDVNNLFYPTLLLLVSVFLVIGLGLFQWLTTDTEPGKQRKSSQDVKK